MHDLGSGGCCEFVELTLPDAFDVNSEVTALYADNTVAPASCPPLSERRRSLTNIFIWASLACAFVDIDLYCLYIH